MRKFYATIEISVFAAFMTFSSASAMNASGNAEAIKWFNQAALEKDISKKIEAYKKAIAADAKFVEAYYNLGMLEKKQKNFVEALKYFQRADQIKNRRIKRETRVSILYDLASMHKQLGNIPESISTLRRAKKSVKDREKRAQIIFELSRVLHDEKRFEEALTEAMEGKELSPAYKNLFGKIIESANNAMTLQKLYTQALEARSRNETSSALSFLEQIQHIDGSYRDVDRRIANLRASVKEKDRQSSNLSAFKQAQSYEREGKLEMAIAIYENLRRTSGASIPGLEERLRRTRLQFEKKKTEKEARKQYLAGDSAFKNGDWIQAVIAFERVLKIEPNNKAVARRLQKAQEALDDQGRKTQVIELYVEGMTAMRNEDYSRALTAFENVRILDPNYKEANGLIEKIERTITEQAFASQTPIMTTPDRNQDADPLYQRALGQMAAENWRDAAGTLELLNNMSANRYDVSDLLATTRAKVIALDARAAGAETQTAAEESSGLLIAGVITTILLLPIIGFLTLSPAVRARLYLLAGKYAAATTIYEGLLEKNPGRLKFYTPLAKAYLQDKRSDARALGVFKKILQLNLVMSNRDEIQAIVNQKYLVANQADTEAISVLENALSDEMRKA